VAEPGFRHNCALLLRSGHEKVKAPKRRRADGGGDGVRCPQKVSFIGRRSLGKKCGLRPSERKIFIAHRGIAAPAVLCTHA